MVGTSGLGPFFLLKCGSFLARPMTQNLHHDLNGRCVRSCSLTSSLVGVLCSLTALLASASAQRCAIASALAQNKLPDSLAAKLCGGVAEKLEAARNASRDGAPKHHAYHPISPRRAHLTVSPLRVNTTGAGGGMAPRPHCGMYRFFGVA